MHIPISGTASQATTLAAGTSFFHLFYGTDAGVFIGAFAGAVVYVLSSVKLTRLAQVGSFIASFLIGIIASEMTADVIGYFINEFLSHKIIIDKNIGATVSAATGVYILLKLRKLDFFNFIHNFLTRGSHGNDNK